MENKSLFQISQEYMAIADALEYDELTPELEASLVINQQELAAKSENYLYVISALKADIARAKDFEAQAKAYRARKERAVERLEQALCDAAKLHGGKFEAGVYTVSTRKSEKVVVQFPDVIPGEYQRKKVTIEPDKVKIKKALQEGVNVLGCHLEVNTSLSIR